MAIDLTELGYDENLERSRFKDTQYSADGSTSEPQNSAQLSSSIPSGSISYAQTALSTLVTGEDIQTEDFVSGSTGWQIKGDGSAEFNDVTIRGTVYASAGEIGGWDITTSYIYSLSSGTPTSTPNNGIVMRDSNPVLIVYEGINKRAEYGYLSSGVYGIKGYATDGTTALFELSDAQNMIAGWTISSTTLANSTNIILDSSNKAISINSATWQAQGIQLQYNAGVPRFYAGDGGVTGSDYYMMFDGTNIAWNAITTSLSTAGLLTTTSALIGGWNVIDGYIYNLQSGTPSSSPSDGIVLASGNEALIVYEDTAKRVEVGYLSLGVYGLKAYATNGTDVIFEASDTQQKMAGWYFDTTSLADNSTTANAKIYIDSANTLIRAGATTGNYLTLDGSNLRLRSSNYSSGVAGAGFTLEPDLLEVGNIAARGMIRTAVFQKSVISAVGGSFAVMDADTLATDMTALDASTLTVSGATTFAVNDILRIKDGLSDEWLLVTNIASAPTYTVTRDQAGAYGADTNPAWKKGASVVNYGASGEGQVYMTASDTNAPFVSIFTHAGSPWSTTTERVRLGNLTGKTNPYGGGALTGYGLWTDNVYLSGTIVSTSGTIGGWVLGTYTLTCDTGAVGLNCEATVADDIRIWAGDATPASAEFRVYESGAIVATSATITGSITATTGAIGGWVVTATQLADAAGVVGMSSAVTIGDDIRFWAGNVIPASAPFRVTEAGVLTATSGNIGGWSLSSAAIYYDGAADANSSGMAPSDYPFYAGKKYTDRATAPFRVTPAGALTATSATITGSVTATNGAIGGWTITATAMTSGTGATTTSMDSGGTNPAFYAGSATPGSAPFRVTQAGALTATSATITGDITATSGYFQTVTLGKTGTASGTLTLQLKDTTGDTYIAAGKTDFTTTTAGFILGLDDSDSDKAKIYLGDSSNYLYWDGTSLKYTGVVGIDPETNAFSLGRVQVSDSWNAVYVGTGTLVAGGCSEALSTSNVDNAVVYTNISVYDFYTDISGANPKWMARVKFSATTDQEGLIGLGQVVATDQNLTNTTDHCAFLIGDAAIVASVGNGTNQEKSADLSGTYPITTQHVYYIEPSGTHFKFYIDGVLVHTSTQYEPNSGVFQGTCSLRTSTTAVKTMYVMQHTMSFDE